MRRTSTWACVVAAAVTLAGQAAAAQTSHLGQNINDHVVLRSATFTGRFPNACPATGSFNDRALFRVWPDGTRSPEPFTVPVSQLLVITDVEWSVDALSSGLPLTPGGTVRARLHIGSGTTFNPVFLSSSVETASESGAVYGTERLAAGVVVAANTAICPGAAEFGPSLVKTARLYELVMRGYLTASH